MRNNIDSGINMRKNYNNDMKKNNNNIDVF